MGLLLSKILSEILLSVRPFSMISAITCSFQVYFGPVNYQSEGFPMLLQMTVNWPTNSKQSLAMTPVKLAKTLISLRRDDSHEI